MHRRRNQKRHVLCVSFFYVSAVKFGLMKLWALYNNYSFFTGDRFKVEVNGQIDI